ncbi:MAG TPA: hypothetical protein VNQ77_14835 [Frankiaceae bacterium]|nr:hypothetical protein [Frankiaceae bacterium]
MTRGHQNGRHAVAGEGAPDDLARADLDAAVDDDLDGPVDEAAVAAVHSTARERLRRIASQVYSIRIPVDRLEDLRALAAARGEAPTALMREWVLERLAAETLGDPGPAPLSRTAVAGDAAAIRAAAEALTRATEALTSAIEARDWTGAGAGHPLAD